VRSTVLSGARSCLIAFLAVGLLNIPAMAVPAKPLGMIVGAENASLDKESAVNGADIFVGDDLVTHEKGSMRFQVGASQLYMLASTAARLDQKETTAQVAVDRGTLGFSTSTPAQLEIVTPLGMLRGANGNPFSGQVAVLGSGKVRVTSFKGTLVVSSDGEEKSIGEGQTWEGTLAANVAGGGSPTPIPVGSSGVNWVRVATVGGIILASVLVACELWPESTSAPGCFP